MQICKYSQGLIKELAPEICPNKGVTLGIHKPLHANGYLIDLTAEDIEYNYAYTK